MVPMRQNPNYELLTYLKGTKERLLERLLPAIIGFPFSKTQFGPMMLTVLSLCLIGLAHLGGVESRGFLTHINPWYKTACISEKLKVRT